MTCCPIHSFVLLESTIFRRISFGMLFSRLARNEIGQEKTVEQNKVETKAV